MGVDTYGRHNTRVTPGKLHCLPGTHEISADSDNPPYMSLFSPFHHLFHVIFEPSVVKMGMGIYEKCGRSSNSRAQFLVTCLTDF